MEAKEPLINTNPYHKILVDESSGVEVPNEKYQIWEEGFKVGMREIVDWIRNREKFYTNPHFRYDTNWKDFLKENELK